MSFDPAKHADTVLHHYISQALDHAQLDGHVVTGDMHRELQGLIAGAIVPERERISHLEDLLDELEAELSELRRLQRQIDELADGQGALEARTARHDARWKMLNDDEMDWPPEDPEAIQIDDILITATMVLTAVAVVLLLWS